MEYGVWSEEHPVPITEYGVQSMEEIGYGIWTMAYGIFNMEYGMWNVECGMDSPVIAVRK